MSGNVHEWGLQVESNAEKDNVVDPAVCRATSLGWTDIRLQLSASEAFGPEKQKQNRQELLKAVVCRRGPTRLPFRCRSACTLLATVDFRKWCIVVVVGTTSPYFAKSWENGGEISGVFDFGDLLKKMTVNPTTNA